ncbi:DUF4125 family protein [Desulfosarcina ovata]|uniref:DUF4125 domain-containing protein n=1 Tax=Desulfosarcina ovata subsp. ovata TaxID=2752305 RepID=A0A5K8A6E8_9BACT|nr:DUF4125 family protein [Desulfosarcina ovata]BBO88087.1 hypothetical protein DSCOOX_12670 [Desulfosarcina ovata subsp. ovata]
MTAISNFIEKILNIEWQMFKAIKSAAPVSCQDSPETFKEVRGSVFEIWSEEMLDSYLGDLKLAQEKGRNLLTEKYARMDNLIPPLKINPLINEIVSIEADWQKELKEKYPLLYARTCRGTDAVQNGNNFSIYLKSELETYSDRTIELYYSQIKEASENKKNLSAQALDCLVQKSGYRNIEHAEKYLTTSGNSRDSNNRFGKKHITKETL